MMSVSEKTYFTNGWLANSLSELDQSSILEVFNCLEDDYSKRTYLCFVNWRVHHEEIADIPLDIIPEEDKYHNDITSSLSSCSGVFVDVGAYDLTFSLRTLNENGLITCCYAFEPEDVAYEICRKVLSDNPSLSPNIILEKIAITDMSGELSFVHGNGLASRIVREKHEGLGSAQVTTLDEYFHDKADVERIAAIKFHIEGDELPALRSSMQIIERDRPLLMFNCSHNRDGLWAIQRECLSLPNYKYYMRSYAYCGEGLTFYAIPV